jgi:predicted nuclease of predicted toxin-antitoxin system
MVKNKRLFASFYFDEDVSVIVAKIIRAHGFKVVCASEVKECGRSDEEQLQYATKNSHILVTHNIRDFMELHRDCLKKGFHHYGIILATRKRDNYEFARRLLELLQQIEPGGLDNQIRYI